jgi:methionyl-tRNA synthetase
MDIRSGTILEAEKMPKANKLLILKVDTGIDVRTIVSGIAESFKPEDIIGKRNGLVNLAPKFAWCRKSGHDINDYKRMAN